MSDHPPPTGDAHDLAVLLEPALHASTSDERGRNRLGEIEWFRSQWQRGGAATGFATWACADGSTVEVLVKMPVGGIEYRWTTALGTCGTPGTESWREAASRPSPRVVAAGVELGGYDLAWLVVERLGGTLGSRVDEAAIHDMLRATGEFQARAGACAPVEGRHRAPDFAHLIERSRELARVGGVAEAQLWKDALKQVHRVEERLLNIWESRAINAWCHGDVHPGNAMRRPESPSSGCVLIDLALVHPGHWVEDALYLERQFWGHADRLHGIKPVSELARYRREHGLPADDNYPLLANVRRVLSAAAAPALMDREGSPKYLHAALETIEKVLPQVGH